MKVFLSQSPVDGPISNETVCVTASQGSLVESQSPVDGPISNQILSDPSGVMLLGLNRLPTGPFQTAASETLILQGFQTPVSRISPVLCQYTSKLTFWQVFSCP